MSRGNLVVINIAKQTAKTVPVVGWKNFPRKTDSLNNTIELTDSETITPSRVKSAGAPTSAVAAGDIETEVIRGVYDDYIAAAAGNAWVGDVLTFGGKKVDEFAIEKTFPNGDLHHMWLGMRVNTFSLDIPEKGMLGMKFGWMGLDYALSAIAKAVTPAITPLEPKATSLSITDIEIDDITMKNRACVTAFGFEVNNNMEISPCLLGGMYGVEVAEYMQDMSGALTVSYNAESQKLIDKQLTGATISISALITFSDGSTYTLNIPKAQLSGDLPAGGKDRLDASLTYTVVSDGTGTDLPTLTRTAPTPTIP